MFARCLILLVAVASLLACIGCVQPQPAPAPAPDPFLVTPPADCPGGICPLGETGSEVSYLGSAAEVDQLAASEVKRDECLPCKLPQGIVTPAALPTALASAPAEQIKHGAFRCEVCKSPVVGEGWEDLWTDDGLSLHCMCTTCFAKSNPKQREAALNNFLSRADPSLIKRPDVQEAIREAATR